MPRNVSGIYALPVTGNPVVTGTVIDATWANTSFNDFATQFNNVITRDGLLGFTAPALAVDGSAVAPGYAFAGQASTGIYRTSTFLGFSYAGIQKAIIDAAGLSVVGNLTLGSAGAVLEGDMSTGNGFRARTSLANQFTQFNVTPKCL